MDRKREILILNILGIFFLLWGIMQIYVSSFLTIPEQIFWYCYIGILLLGAGFLMKNPLLVGAQLTIMSIPLLLWNIDFFHFLITNRPLWGLTDYIFLTDRIAISQIISMQHLFTVPLALYGLHLMKPKRIDFWKISLAELTILYIPTRILTSPENNINCIFHNCLNILLPIPHIILWFLAVTVMVLLTNCVISLLPFIRSTKK